MHVVLTSSTTNVQSLSSSSYVRGSLNSVTEIVLLSGTGHRMRPFSESIMSGSHGCGVEATRRDRRVHTTDRLDGRLDGGSGVCELKSFSVYSLATNSIKSNHDVMFAHVFLTPIMS